MENSGSLWYISFMILGVIGLILPFTLTLMARKIVQVGLSCSMNDWDSLNSGYKFVVFASLVVFFMVMPALMVFILDYYLWPPLICVFNSLLSCVINLGPTIGVSPAWANFDISSPFTPACYEWDVVSPGYNWRKVLWGLFVIGYTVGYIYWYFYGGGSDPKTQLLIQQLDFEVACLNEEIEYLSLPDH